MTRIENNVKRSAAEWLTYLENNPPEPPRTFYVGFVRANKPWRAMTSQELLSVIYTNFMITANAWLLCCLVAGLVFWLLSSYGYVWIALLLGIIPVVLDVTAVWVYRKMIKPHKVGKYVIQNKQLPDDL